MTHIIICDDSPRDIDHLSQILNSYYDNHPITIHTFQSGLELMAYLEHGGACQIAFLDIVMPGLSGIDLAKSLRSIRYNGYLIFMTNSNDFAAESYQVGAFSYLLKPAADEEISTLLDNIAKHMQKNDTANLLVQTKRNKQRVPFHDIIFLESNKHHLYFHLTGSDNVLSVYASFPQYEPALMEDSRFIRCHRTFIINMDHVISVQKQEFIMQGGITIPISKNFTSCKQQYINYILEKEAAQKW